jgi:hypothetical protein
LLPLSSRTDQAGPEGGEVTSNPYPLNVLRVVARAGGTQGKAAVNSDQSADVFCTQDCRAGYVLRIDYAHHVGKREERLLGFRRFVLRSGAATHCPHDTLHGPANSP